MSRRARVEDADDGVSAYPDRERGNRRGDLVRAGMRGIGQTLITLGLVLLLFVVYEVWVTNIFADRKQNQVYRQFQRSITTGEDPLKGVDRLKLPAGRQVVLPAGEGFANLYIPALGKDYAFTIVQGVNDADLEKGPGHYPGTAIPGQVGNFAVAGHRVGKGEPFLNLDQLGPGDAVVVQTARNWYVYDVLGDRKTGNLDRPGPQGVVGRQIVAPGDIAVIDPVPGRPGTKPTQVLMTMTTCHPKYSADRRMVVHALLARAVAASGKQTPRELGGTL
ncbi:MAG: class E sortase [bacterium]